MPRRSRVHDKGTWVAQGRAIYQVDEKHFNILEGGGESLFIYFIVKNS